jgi:predicted CXXCH cytochrome family protein
VETAYVYSGAAETKPAAVSHVEQLAISACLRGSAGKLWCGTCHNPHGSSVDRKADILRICTSCHPSVQLAATHQPGPQSGANDCVSCHMPRRQASDIAHAVVTDHRILRRPNQSQPAPALTPQLAPWREPGPSLADRNLGLALFNVGKQSRSLPALQKAFTLLSHVSDKKDASVAAAVGYLLLGSGQTRAAVDRFQQAVSGEPSNCEYWLDLGVAQEAAGDNANAATSLRRSIEANPYDYRSYQALAELYTTANQPARAQSVRDEFQRLVPQNLILRSEAH